MKLFCPGCGSPVEFRYDDSFVRVCSACRTAIVRTDRGVDSFGQVADLIPTRSGLALGDRGRFRGLGFTLVGRAGYRHPAGGSWEEWYLRLDDGRWAWLAEAQGSWVVTFPRPDAGDLPSFGELRPELTVALGQPPIPLVIGECNTSTLIGAEGEIPFQFTPGAIGRFADLSDGKGRFATLDYGPPESNEPPTVFLGRRASLAELELTPSVLAGVDERQISGDRLACPNCGGSIELLVPGKSLSVACPYCGSLLDCEKGLSVLALQEHRTPGRLPFALGASAEFYGVRYTVTGLLERQAKYDSMTLEWDEWLLHSATAGYRWLARARGHYSFVTPLAPGSVRDGSDGTYYAGRRFALYDSAEPSVSGVWGEFYWKVSVGETVKTRDYIAPPAMLSYEWSPTEVHWSLGVYQTPEQIRRAFGLEALPESGAGVAGNQPFRHPWLGKMTLLIALGFAICTFLRMSLAADRAVYSGRVQLGGPELAGGIAPTDAMIGGYPTYVFFTPRFELRAHENTSVSLNLPVTNNWAYATIDLIHEESGELRTFASEISYYYGSDGGEAWSEGGHSTDTVLPAGRAGPHLLRVELQTPTALVMSLGIDVVQNVFPASQLGWALLILAIPGACFALYQWAFERQRWSESDYAPSLYRASGGSDD